MDNEKKIITNQVQDITYGEAYGNSATFADILDKIGMDKDVQLKHVAFRTQEGKDVILTADETGVGELASIKRLTGWLSHLFFTIGSQVIESIGKPPMSE